MVGDAGLAGKGNGYNLNSLIVVQAAENRGVEVLDGSGRAYASRFRGVSQGLSYVLLKG
jgi:hypothetical protein